MMYKEFDPNNKQDWVKAVRAVVFAIQKTRSIKSENSGLENFTSEQMKIRNYIAGWDNPDKLENYLKAFIKMQDKGDDIHPMDAYNISFFANRLYPEIGILCCSSDINIPAIRIPPTWSE